MYTIQSATFPLFSICAEMWGIEFDTPAIRKLRVNFTCSNPQNEIKIAIKVSLYLSMTDFRRNIASVVDRFLLKPHWESSMLVSSASLSRNLTILANNLLMLAPIDKPRVGILCNVERTLLLQTCYAGMKPGRWYAYK